MKQKIFQTVKQLYKVFFSRQSRKLFIVRQIISQLFHATLSIVHTDLSQRMTLLVLTCKCNSTLFAAGWRSLCAKCLLLSVRSCSVPGSFPSCPSPALSWRHPWTCPCCRTGVWGAGASEPFVPLCSGDFGLGDHNNRELSQVSSLSEECAGFQNLEIYSNFTLATLFASTLYLIILLSFALMQLPVHLARMNLSNLYQIFFPEHKHSRTLNIALQKVVR